MSHHFTWAQTMKTRPKSRKKKIHRKKIYAYQLAGYFSPSSLSLWREHSRQVFPKQTKSRTKEITHLKLTKKNFMVWYGLL